MAILSHGRWDTLSALLVGAARECRAFDGRAEVIVVDDSDASTGEKIFTWCQELGFSYHYLPGSIARKRNYAAAHCQFPIVLFVDSDCQICPGLFRAHLDAYTGPDIGGVLGLVEFHGEDSLFWDAIEQTNYTVAFSFARRMDFATWGPCANHSFRTSVLTGIGGFKECFPYDYSGEDVDIGLRINDAGQKIRCNQDALVFHERATWARPASFLRKVFRWGRTDYHLSADHRARMFVEFLRFPLVAVACLAVLLPILLIAKGPVAVFLVAIPILAPPAIHAALRAKRPFQVRFWCANVIAFFLERSFDSGLLYESVRHRDLRYYFWKILYDRRQLQFEIDDRVRFAGAVLVSMLMLLYLVLV